jgi:general stress protein 26
LLYFFFFEKFYFSTFTRSQKARNLEADPRCVVCTDGADEAVIVEGIAKEVTDPAVSEKFEEAYEEKYQEKMDTSQGVLYAVHPRVAFAFISTAEDFPGSATRWRFPND